MFNHSSFPSPNSLPRLADLLLQRENQMKELIGDMKYDDVKTDLIYEKTKANIAGSTLFQEIAFGDSSLIDHDSITRPLSFEEQVLGTNPTSVYHRIRVEFTGSTELATHRPDSYGYSSSDRGILTPEDDEHFEVIVKLNTLNKDQALKSASHQLNLTRSLIDSNNEVVKTWNVKMLEILSKLADEQRKKLTDAYG
jgi:hypothetical protein